MTDTPTPDTARSGTFWVRFRIPIIIAAVAGWVVLISLVYLRPSRAGSSANKGTQELLKIGALPVT
jgi:hypothetical protein